jgi:hypothetical protein
MPDVQIRNLTTITFSTEEVRILNRALLNDGHQDAKAISDQIGLARINRARAESTETAKLLKNLESTGAFGTCNICTSNLKLDGGCGNANCGTKT